MKKGCLIAFVLVVVLVAGLVMLVFTATKGVVDASDKFLAKLGEGKVSEAYASTGKALRDAQSEANFGAVVKQLGLDGYASSSWTTREIKNNEGRVEGTVTTKSGAKIPVEIVLLHESEEWKVVGFHGQAAGGTATPAKAPIPGDAELKKLVTASLLAFNEGAQSKDFTEFHRSLSVPFKQQFPPERLKQTFQPFIDAGADVARIRTLEPVFDAPPAVNPDGVLILNGYYPTTPTPVKFNAKYVYEHPVWKLIGIDVTPE